MAATRARVLRRRHRLSRRAIDKRAALGWQPEPFGGAPAYVMPNTSGLNAHAKPADFAEHLRIGAAAARVS